MTFRRKQYEAAFKVRVALEAVKGEKPLLISLPNPGSTSIMIS
jgi:hypothetical protein